ncbi:MAG: CoA-binding protein [Tatlockia sp.]|nr:CoA-binding protein [Tatlockia sp.]
MKSQTEQFFKSKAYAVVGASNNREKYGNKVLRCYLQNYLNVYPVNPNEDFIEGLISLASLSDLPDSVESISIITSPEVTEKIVDQAIQKKIKNIWMQPGAETELAIEKCLKNGINIISNGPCILVDLGFVD